MSKLEIVKQESFGAVKCDFFKDDEQEIYMTINQLAEALEYSSREGVKKILERNDYLRKEEFSTSYKLSLVEGSRRVSRERTVFTEDGIYEVTMLSQKPKARKFRAWVRKVVKDIRKYGMYAKDELLDNPDLLIDVATKYKEEREQRKKLEKQVEQNRPKVLFADSVEASKDSILIRELAKILKQNGVDTGQNRLFAWMRENGYLIKKKGSDYNTPTQRAMNMGLFEVKKTTINTPDGTKVSKTPKVTGKGQRYFINKLKQFDQVS